jgi:CheY-like chemotaxis protein
MKGAKILVVEDEFITLMEIENILETLGYQSYLASSSDEAIQLALEVEPDLILMDIKLRGNDDGVKTIQIIQNHMDVEVIYLTAHLSTELQDSIQLTHPVACILKPFLKKELINSIEIALTRNENIESYANVYRFFGMIGTLLASSIPYPEKKNFLNQFSRLFEENMRLDFVSELEKYNLERLDLHVYLTCLSTMLDNLGFHNNRMANESWGYMMISSCPWKYGKQNEIFCQVCQLIAQITLSWTDVVGKVNLDSCFIKGDIFCGFRFELENVEGIK